MIQNALHARLRPLIDAEATLRRRKSLALVFSLGSAVLIGLFVAAWFFHWGAFGSSLLVVAAIGIAALITAIISGASKIDPKAVVNRIEESHPDLKLALLTAMEQQPGPSGELGYLQEKLILQAVDHAIKHDWVRNTSRKRLLAAGWQQAFAVLSFVLVAMCLLGELFRQQIDPLATAETRETAAEVISLGDYEIEVRPGNTEVERGTRLVVEAAFLGERIPPGATIVMSDPRGDKAERGRIAMKPGLDEAVFSGLLAKVDSDATYRIEFDGATSDEFSIKTFIHPLLEQADVTITAPAYANLPEETLEDVRKVSLLEGSTAAWSMKLNKPIAAAELFGEDETSIELAPSAEDPTRLTASHIPEITQKYRLHLVDDEGRSNKQPPWFTVTVKKNLPPELEFKFPKRDVKVTSVQELPVEATVYDDLGVTGAGATFEFQGKATEVALAEAGAILEGDKSHALQTTYTLEKIGAKPRDLVTYHLWAEDIGPDGTKRRTMSDQFFAEVRHFEDIFREAESAPPGEGEGQTTPKLLKLQKEVMNANWKLIRLEQMGRDFSTLVEDIGVVSESQEIARGMTLEAIAEVDDPEFQQYLTEAAAHMEAAVSELNESIGKLSADKLILAHTREKDAYQSLLLAQSREHNITRMKDPSKGKGQSEMEEQMMELEMKQEDKRYEEESKAQDSQTPEQQEALVVLNRLKDLAKRQEAIAEKIKELQNSLEEAETPEEKEELERQLERLQEEQKELLRELDTLTERMDTDENRANMAEERQKLEETREKVQEASEQLDEGNLADAANAATRAERELDEVTEDFREKTSRAFSEEIESIRDQARQLAENQEKIGEKLDESNRLKERSDAANENGELASEIESQREALDQLLEEMRQLSEASDESEPILSNTLYEAVRDARTNGIDDSLAEARNLTSYGRREIAQEEERAAARGIDALKEQAEKAAEMVLGSEAESLRMARSELEDLIEQTRTESERLAQNGEEEEGPQAPTPGETEGDAPGEKSKGDGQKGEKGEQPGEMAGAEAAKGEKGEAPGQGKGEGDQPGEALAEGGEKGKGKGGSKGEGSEPGESMEAGKGPGKGKGSGEPSIAEGKGKGEKGKGQGKGQGEGEGEGLAQGESNGNEPGQAGSSSGGQRLAGTSPGGGQKGSGGGGESKGKPMFFNTPQAQQPAERGPITGEDYEKWADRLRNIESMVNEDELRNEVAKVLDDARAMRIDFRSDNLPPQANSIEQRITNPLVEIRNRVAEELAKLDKNNPLAPIDRDPVPQEYRELVRKYYEELGSGK